MRVERLEIDGFGRFHDDHWALPEGLSVLCGANEAGKTTLLNALRALLFGFEATRDGRTWYPALEGGRRGGRLTLLTAAGERWTVERHGERGGTGALAVRAPNGNQGGQETLDRLLHGADRDLFNNIFAFGLGELQSFSSLSAEGVRGRIYGAGAGLGGTSAVELERRLRQQQEATFTVRGSQKPLNALLARIETLRAEVADLGRQPAEHEEAVRQRDELRRTAAALAEELRARRRVAIRLDHLRRAAGPAAELAGIEVDLAVGDASLDELPTDAVATLDRHLADLAEARATLAAIDERIDEASAARDAIRMDRPVIDAADEIVAMRDERVERSAAQREQQDLAAAEARHAAAVSEQLARAGGWDEGRLLSLDDSIPTVEATREMESALARAAEAHASAEQRHLSLADQLDARGVSARVAHGDEDLEDRGAALRELAALGIQRAAAGAAAPARLSPSVAAMAVAGLVLAAGLALGVATAQPLMGVIVGGLLGVAVLLVVGRPGVGSSVDRLGELDDRRTALLQRAGLPADATDDDVHAASDELAAERARRALAREQEASRAARNEELERRARELAAAAETLTAATSSWREWLAARGMPDDLSPEAARQLLAVAGAARRAAVERDQVRARLAAHRRDAAAFDERLGALLVRVGIRPEPIGSPRDAQLAGLVERLERARADDHRAAELDTTLERLRTRREPAAALVAEREAAVRDYLAAVGCPDADELRRRDAAAAERRALRARARELSAELAGIAGGSDAVAELRQEVATSDAAVVEADLEAATAEQDRLERESRDVQQRIGELDGRIRDLEAAAELGARRQELAVLEGRAAALAREWSVRAVALRLLEETRSRYERERQPDVVRAAESHFARITGGRYARIVAPPGDTSVRVETEGGEARVTDELSRGTAEQLYLALRFGLIEEFARHAEPLPVVMDDILVNFDADRAARAAAAIRDLATRHQVLYFTCHPWTAELLDPAGNRTLALG